MINILFQTETSKLNQWEQYPPKTENVYSFFTSTGGPFDQTIFFGLQYILHNYFDDVITDIDVEDAEELVNSRYGQHVFNKAGWMRVIDKYNGHLPLSIRAVPEGSIVQNNNILMSIENTDAEFYWLPSYVESLLSQIWYPITMATSSYQIKKTILKALLKTGDEADLDSRFVNLGFKHLSSNESSVISGLSHLINFENTTNLLSLLRAKEIYNYTGKKDFMPIFETGPIASWGKVTEGFKVGLHKYPNGVVSILSDVLDVCSTCEIFWGDFLRKDIVARNGKILLKVESKFLEQVLNILGEKFHFTTNNKGYKVLNSVGIAYMPCSYTHTDITDVLCLVERLGWSADNITFMVQETLPVEQSFEFYTSHVTTDGQEKDIYHFNTKHAGRLKLVQRVDGYETIREEDSLEGDVMEEVFRDGRILKSYSLQDIRERL